MKKYIWLLLALAVVLCACGKQEAMLTLPETSVPTEVTEPPETIPADGNPDDVTCKGSYTGQLNTNVLVASAGDQILTGGELQVWYWAEVAQYRQANHAESPDFDRPLDVQICQIDSTVNSWQQYFLREALDSWHTSRMLMARSETEPMPTEEAYKPDMDSHELRLQNIPATKYLYGHNVYYQLNTMHQRYLEALPQTLAALAEEKGYADAAAMAQEAFGTDQDSLLAYADVFNRGYMYFTAMSYYIEPTQEELAAYYEAHQADYTETGKTVDIRHILLVPKDIVQEPEKKWGVTEPTEPIILEAVEVAADGTVTCSEEAWSICEAEANALLTGWSKAKNTGEALFADLANKHSDDTGTALDGGAYHGLKQGQLTAILDQWCFDPARQVGDTTILRTPYGMHILYFSGSQELSAAAAEADYYRQQQNELLRLAKQTAPLVVYYSDISLAEAAGTVTPADLLYPDIAHERFPEVPLYLQQDYPDTMYGSFPIRTYGCGITTMAMLASYMADDELTPPEMCARFGNYCFPNGTDGRLFNDEPAGMNFYLREKTFDANRALAALQEGQIVISVQHKGYWTRGGHYIVLEDVTEDNMVQVRDSNIFNYVKLVAHQNDLHKWVNITSNCAGYWIYEDKVTYIPACSRCGTSQGITESLLLSDYICEKCTPALLRRNTYLAGCAE